MGSLTGKNAFVTGTSQGIGSAISKALIEAGCNICMHYFRSAEIPKTLKDLAEGRGQKALCIQADLTNEAEVIKCVRAGTDLFGNFDIMVNNSGSLVQRRYLKDIDNDYWDTLLDINLKSMMMVTREIYPFLNKSEGASIINLASLAGRTGGHSGSLVYSTTKGAVITWSRSLARELASQGIRVNTVAPGFIEGTTFHETHTTREAAVKIREGIPLGRSGRPEDVARAVVFLASEYDGFITGETIDINGGVYCA
jgi:3-oxoacyl-[acyl-carrier protein] reductase